MGDVRASLQRNLDAHRGGRAPPQRQRLAACIDRGMAAVQAEHQSVRQPLQAIERVAATLLQTNGSATERQAQCTRLQEAFAGLATPFYHHVAGGWPAVPQASSSVETRGHASRTTWIWSVGFESPKGTSDVSTGTGMRGCASCRKAPRSCWCWTAQVTHPEPCTAHDLEPYQDASAPPCQVEAIHRRKIMRKARSKKNERSCSQHWNAGT